VDGAQAAAAQWAATFKDFPPVQKPHTFTLDRNPRRAEVSRSEEVRDFYERMPYPAPLTSLDGYRDLYKNPNRRRAESHLIWPAKQPRAGLEILIAGCGTSQAARYALREPDARIAAIDVSGTSLRHTRELQRKYNLENLELHQLPIERVHEIGRSFDLVVCTGVLHHLPDPDCGLRALRDVLRPSGAMRLMVYARYGRAGIYMMQEYCRLLEISVSATDLRSLGAALEVLPADHPISGLLRRSKDFRRPEAMADALLHPQDRAYTVPEIYDWLDRCDVSFGRWIEQAPYLAQCGVLASSPHASRLAALPSRLQHAAAELFRGTMVSHSFIAYRDNSAVENQPITFAGESWRDYIPILLPWTVCIRERLPPGSVAVLINRSHTFTDLILTVDSFEDCLLGAIDGRRTLAQILQFVLRDGDGESRALRFFERLWQYDQIVFDASRVDTSVRDREEETQ
jgi:SAM-dependent methyltransferase